jgi:hypothetical protein
MNRRNFILLVLLTIDSIAWILALRARGGDMQGIVVLAATSLRDSNKKGMP